MAISNGAHATGVAIIGRDAVLEGEIRRGGAVEVYGRITGIIAAERLIVHPGASVFGTIRVDAADVNGALEGDIGVKTLMVIGAGGDVRGKVKYGQLSMTAGAGLDADVRNIPPRLGGDFEIAVRRGQMVALTLDDLTAYDPDSQSDDLHYTVSRVQNGRLALVAAPGVAVERFSQADLASGRVVFIHDGSGGPDAAFDVVVSDQAGGTSPARTVTASVAG